MILFEMLTGRVPFDGDNAVAIALKQVSEQPPPPSSINPAVTPALDAVVLKALAKDPANRYQLRRRDARRARRRRGGPGDRRRTPDALAAYGPPTRRTWTRTLIAAGVAALVAARAVRSALSPAPRPAPTGHGARSRRARTETEATAQLQAAGFNVVAEPDRQATRPTGRCSSRTRPAAPRPTRARR